MHDASSGSGRGPRGPCGLKSTGLLPRVVDFMSRPARALWIEITLQAENQTLRFVEAREGLVD